MLFVAQMEQTLITVDKGFILIFLYGALQALQCRMSLSHRCPSQAWRSQSKIALIGGNISVDPDAPTDEPAEASAELGGHPRSGLIPNTLLNLARSRFGFQPA